MKKDLLILLLLIVPSFSTLLRTGYFSMHDDLQSMRQLELNKCIIDGQIPCRWTSDMGYGYGYPLFNFYPPFPYILGQFFTGLGFAYIDVVKIVGVLGFCFTALGAYLLSKEFWGRSGGLISSLLYTYAPYHSVDFYVRGAMNEFWAMAFYPFIFLSAYKLITTKSPKFIPIFAISFCGLMLSHNPMLMIFTPFFVIWILLWLSKSRSIKSIPYLFISGLLGVGIASFFTLPVLFEQKYAHVETLVIGYFNFLAHYLDLNQIFLRLNWGYGESILGPNDTMSFFLGYLHWILPGFATLFILFSKKLRSKISLIIFLFCSLGISLFMTHSKSTPIWLFLKPLEFLQFPWRFLTVATFIASLLAGAAIFAIPQKYKRISVTLMILAILLLNVNLFHPRQWYPDMTDAKKFSGASWQLLITSGIFDYLPKTAAAPPASQRVDEINVIKGEAVYSPLVFKTNYQEYLVSVFNNSATVELQTYYFPGWNMYLDGKKIEIDPKRDPLLGRMQVDISPGKHTLKAVFENTPIRTIGNTISLISIIITVFYSVYLLKRKICSPIFQ